MADRPHILFFFEAGANGQPIVGHLLDDGFEVTAARTFLEAVWALAGGRVQLFLIYLPEIEWARNAILTEVRRCNAALPIVALAPATSDALAVVLDRLRVTTVLSADSGTPALIAQIRKALGARAVDPEVGD